MAISDLLVGRTVFPCALTVMYVDYWLIGGPLGLASCKLVFFIADVSNLVFIQSLALIAADRFGAVLFPLASPRISKSIHALRPGCKVIFLVELLAGKSFQLTLLLSVY